MRSVFLVDDDLTILQHVRGLLDWRALGYEIVGQAMTGPIAVEKISRLQPSLVLLDVQLPGLDGVEVLRNIRRECPRTQVIMLSNYDTFAFVRSALKLGAFDYLLKQDLTAEALRAKLDSLPAVPDDNVSAENRSDETLRNCLYVMGMSNAPMPKEKLGRGHLLIFEINHFEALGILNPYHDASKLIAAVGNILYTLSAVAANCVFTHLAQGMFAILIYDPKGEPRISKSAQDMVLLLKSNIRRMLGLSVTAAVSGPLCSTAQLRSAYAQICSDTFPTPLPAPSLKVEQGLVTALRFSQHARLQELLDAEFERWKGHSVHQTAPAAAALLRVGQRFCLEQNILFPEEETSAILEAFRGYMLLPQLIEQVQKYYALINRTWLGNETKEISPHVVHALEYIHKHYAEDISLSSVAQALHLSSEHLARLFKKELGASLSQVLTRHRLQVARSLIQEQHLKAADVYERVGFHSQSYFMRAYKKNMGQTIGQDLTDTPFPKP